MVRVCGLLRRADRCHSPNRLDAVSRHERQARCARRAVNNASDPRFDENSRVRLDCPHVRGKFICQDANRQISRRRDRFLNWLVAAVVFEDDPPAMVVVLSASGELPTSSIVSTTVFHGLRSTCLFGVAVRLPLS